MVSLLNWFNVDLQMLRPMWRKPERRIDVTFQFLLWGIFRGIIQTTHNEKDVRKKKGFDLQHNKEESTMMHSLSVYRCIWMWLLQANIKGESVTEWMYESLTQKMKICLKVTYFHKNSSQTNFQKKSLKTFYSVKIWLCVVIWIKTGSNLVSQVNVNKWYHIIQVILSF